jgi:hypothetical protein
MSFRCNAAKGLRLLSSSTSAKSTTGRGPRTDLERLRSVILGEVGYLTAQRRWAPHSGLSALPIRVDWCTAISATPYPVKSVSRWRMSMSGKATRSSNSTAGARRNHCRRSNGVDRCSRARGRHLLSRGGDGRCVPMCRRWLLTAGSSRFSGVRCAVLVLRLVRVGVVRPRALFGQAEVTGAAEVTGSSCSQPGRRSSGSSGGMATGCWTSAGWGG